MTAGYDIIFMYPTGERDHKSMIRHHFMEAFSHLQDAVMQYEEAQQTTTASK
jgi:hypothetical protein